MPAISSESVTGFLKLPSELRVEIYRILLLTTNLECSAPHQERPHVSIIRTCRQIRSEAAYVLYQENTFVHLTTADMNLRADLKVMGGADPAEKHRSDFPFTFDFRVDFHDQDELPIYHMIVTVADLPDVCLSLWIILPDKINFSFKLHRPFPETLVSKATQKSFLDPLEMFWGIEHLNIEGLFDKDMVYDVENSMKRTILSSPEQVIKTIMALTTEAKEQLHQGNSTQSIFFSAQA